MISYNEAVVEVCSMHVGQPPQRTGLRATMWFVMELVQELGGCEIVLVEPVSMDMTLEAQSVSGSAVHRSLTLVVNIVSYWVGNSTRCFTQVDLKHRLGLSPTKSLGVQPFHVCVIASQVCD